MSIVLSGAKKENSYEKTTFCYHFYNTPPEYDNYYFSGLVKGKKVGKGKIVISPNKIFKKVFGFECPDNTIITLL